MSEPSDYHLDGTPIFDIPPCYDKETRQYSPHIDICTECHYFYRTAYDGQYVCHCFQLEITIFTHNGVPISLVKEGIGEWRKN